MTEFVIIGKDEGGSVDAMIRSIEPYGWPIHYVADRCSDDTIARLSKYPEVDVIDTSDLGWDGRQVSRARNLGFSKVAKGSGVVFLDGDRYPIHGDIQKSIDNNPDVDVLLFRIDEDIRRRTMFWEFDHYGEVYNLFYSCGLYMSPKAVEAVTEAMDGRIFDDQLGTMWGVEDLFLGDVCHALGLRARIGGDVILNGNFDSSPICGIRREHWNLRMAKRKEIYDKNKR